MSRPFLLDINVLIALFDSAHIHHLQAHEWFSKSGCKGWRTCPLTENGLLRILSHPAYPNSALPIVDVAKRLEEFKSSSKTYHFWIEDFSTASWLSKSMLSVRSNQATDAYLLMLCKNKCGALATFDRRISPALIGETESELIQNLPV
jgi:toxin-antitoxin system PIN domain toxin